MGALFLFSRKNISQVQQPPREAGRVAPEVRLARGIAAEPPKPRSGEGDGADSPTRAKRSGSPKGILLRKIQLKIKN
jgi:hypothetical protein